MADALTKKSLNRLGVFTTFLSGVTGKTGFQGGAITEVGIPQARADSSPPAAYVADVPLWQSLFGQWYGACDTAGLWVTAWASGPNWGDYNLGIHVNDSAYTSTGTNIDKMMSPGAIDVVEAHLPPVGATYRRGVNVAGPEFGHKQPGYTNATPGVHGTDYWFPTAGDVAALSARGIKTIRLPIAWERVQPTLLGALDTTYLGRITAVADACLANGVGMILDVHNYARYEYSDSGTKKVLVLRTAAGIDLANPGPTGEDAGKIGPEYLVDLWRRLSNAYRTHAGVVAYELMNEPHDVPATDGSFTGTTLNDWNAGTVAGWSGGTGVTLAHTTSTPYEGSGALRGSGTTGAAGAFVAFRAERGSVAGAGNTLRGRVRLNGTPTGTWQARFEWQTAGFSWQTANAVTLTPGQWTEVLCDFGSNPIAGTAINLALQVHSSNPGASEAVTFDLDLFQRGTVSGALTDAQAWESITQTVLADLRTRADDTTKRDTKLVLVPGHGWNVFGWNHASAWITEPSGLEGSHRYVTHQYFDSQSNGFGESSGTYETVGKRYADAKAWAITQGFTDDVSGSDPIFTTEFSGTTLDPALAAVDTVGGLSLEDGYLRLTNGPGSWGNPRVSYGPVAGASLGPLVVVVRHTNAPGMAGIGVLPSSAAGDPTPAGIVRDFPSYPARYRTGPYVTDRFNPFSNTYLHAVIPRPGGGFLMLVSGGLFGQWPLARIIGVTAAGLPSNAYAHLTNHSVIGAGWLYDRLSVYGTGALPAGATTRFGLALVGDTFNRASLGTTSEFGGRTYAVTGGATITGNRLTTPSAWTGITVTLPSVGGFHEATVVTTASDNGANLIFRKGATNQLTLSANGTASIGVWDSATGNPVTPGANTGAYHMEPNSTHRLSVVDDGDGFRAYLDDQDLFGYVATTLYNTQSGAGIQLNTGTSCEEWAVWPQTVALPAELGPFPNVPEGYGPDTFSEPFTAANGTNLHGYRGLWTVDSGSWSIQTGAAEMATAAANGWATFPTGVGVNHAVGADITVPNTTPVYTPGSLDWYPAVACRFTSAGAFTTYLMARFLFQGNSSGVGSNEVEVWERRANGNTVMVGYANTGTNLSPGSTHRLTLAVYGAEFAAYQDGVLVVQGRTTILDGTRGAIGVADTNPNGKPRWDNVSAKIVYGAPVTGFTNGAMAATGAASTAFTATYLPGGGGAATIHPTGASSVTFHVVRRLATAGGLTGAGAVTLSGRYTDPNRIRAIVQPRGVSSAVFTAQLRDVTPPVFLYLQPAGIAHNRATIVWRTDEPSNNSLAWGTSAGSLTNTITQPAGAYALDHSAQITGLSPSTPYFFRITTADARGNSRQSVVTGFVTISAPPAHRFLIDWNNDSDFADALEDVTEDVLFMEGVTASRGRDQIRQLAPPAAGRYDATLRNDHRKYSPANSASPLVGLIEPGIRVRWEMDYGGVTRRLWTGILDDIPQNTTPGRQTAGMPALGVLSRLRGVNVSTAVYQNVATHTALGYLLDAAGWPAGERVISNGATSLDWWWLQEEDAFSAMLALLSMEGPGAAIYEDGEGRIVFEGRTYRLLQTRSTTVQATFRDTGPEPWRAPELGYEPGLRDVVNQCRVRVEQRAASALGVIWTLGQTVSLAAGEVKSYSVTPANPFQAAVTPVAGTDYTVVSGSVTVTMTRTSGSSTTIFVTAGGASASISGLQLRAQAIPVTNSVLVGENESDPKTVASKTRRGIRSYPLPIRREMNPEVARDFCNVIVQRYRDPRPQVTITVPCLTPATIEAAVARQISDRIAVQDQGTGISMPVTIEQIRWEWRDGVLSAVFGCEQASNENYALWGTAIWDTSVWAF